MTIVTEPGDKAVGERIICQYRREERAVLVQLTGGHRGLRRVIRGLPAEAVVDKKWKIIDRKEDRITIAKRVPVVMYH